MSISDLHPHTGPGPAAGPAGVLAEAVGLVRQAAEAMFAAQPDQALVDTVGLAAQLRAATAAVEAGALAEADHRDLATKKLAYGSTGDWVTHTGGLGKGQGKRLVARAHALTGPLTSTRSALAAGRVSPEQADIIVTSVQNLPSGEAVRARGEQTLLEHAQSLDASDLGRTGRHLAHVVDPDAEDRRLERELAREERAAHHDRYLSIASDGAGGVRLKGRGTAEDGALLKAALLPLTTPTPAADHHDGEGAGDCEGRHRDLRDHGARMWDALIATAQHALDTNLPPQSHGAPTRLMVTTTLEQLQSGLAEHAVTGLFGLGVTGLGVTSEGTELSAATIRRLACDAEIIPAVLGSHGEPLDVGRARRLVTLAIWIALILRDAHCAFPGCTRPPVMCHAHHIIHWLHGGDTKLENLVLLCGHHHHVIHDTPWQVRLNPHDRKPEFLPPPQPGIETQWIRYRPRRE
jgi:hypothetical protein